MASGVQLFEREATRAGRRRVVLIDPGGSWAAASLREAIGAFNQGRGNTAEDAARPELEGPIVLTDVREDLILPYLQCGPSETLEGASTDGRRAAHSAGDVARAGTSYADDEQAVQPPEDIVIVIALCDNPWMLMDAETHQRYPCPTIELAYRLAPRIPVVLAVDPTPGADGATRYTAVCILAWMLAGIAGVVDLPNLHQLEVARRVLADVRREPARTGRHVVLVGEPAVKLDSLRSTNFYQRGVPRRWVPKRESTWETAFRLAFVVAQFDLLKQAKSGRKLMGWASYADWLLGQSGQTGFTHNRRGTEDALLMLEDMWCQEGHGSF